jgi:hypothetical protein
MENQSATNRIRHYCQYHSGSIFDVFEMHKDKFPEIDERSFRKYVSRMVKEGRLTPISKGVYVVGPTLPDNIDGLILQHYLRSDPLVYARESLLFQEGVIDSEPKLTKVFVIWDQGNKRVGDFFFMNNPNLSPFPYYNEKNILLELIYCKESMKGLDMIKLSEALIRHLKQYKEDPYDGKKIIYSKTVYYVLANLLEKLHISNKVITDYESNVKLLSGKEL